MEKTMTTNGNWMEEYHTPEGLIISRICWELEDVDFHRETDWPKIHSFFKQQLIEFDSFYQEFKDILILLVE
jgi:hypothetical protein